MKEKRFQIKNPLIFLHRPNTYAVKAIPKN